MYRPTFFKIELTPSPAETYRMLFKLPYFPVNSRDTIVMHFFKVLDLMKSCLTHFVHIICMGYHEKILTKSEARFLLKLSPLITSWSSF